MRISRPLLVLVILALIAAAGWALQWQRSEALRDELGLLREQSRTVARLRAERARLAQAQLPPGELAALRSDHAAVERLRREVEALAAEVKAKEREANP